jgi:YVTN family beta-propeller protein
MLKRGLLLAAWLAAACGPVSAPSGPRLFVSDEPGGAVAVVDPDAGQVVERIPVGKRPRGLRVSRDGTQLLVAVSGSPIAGPGVDESKLPPPDRSADGIAVVDLASRKLVRTIPSGPDPESFDISPDGKMLYASNEDASEMTALDLSTGTIRGRVHVGEEPEGVTVRPDGRVVYVTCEGDNIVAAVDTTTMTVLSRMTTGARPRAVVFTLDGALAFVTTENGGAVTLLDAVAHTVAGQIPIPRTEGTPAPPRPMGAVLSPDGRQVFVSLGRAKSIAVIDVAGRRLVRTIEDVGARPWGIGVSADGRKVYTANGPSGDVSIVDLATGTVDRRIAAGKGPWGLILAPRR